MESPDPFDALAHSLVRDEALPGAEVPLARQGGAVNLAEAALWIAADFVPGLDVPAQLLRLDALAEEARPTVTSAWSDEARVSALCAFLFDQQGFTGDSEHYEDPSNSLLHEVLERKRGLPITLSLVLLEVGWRLGLPVEGIAFPGHFLVRYRGTREDWMVDAFHARILDDEALGALLREALGDDAIFQRAQLQPVTSHAFLVRLLSNLKRHAALASDFTGSLRCCERLLQLRPDDPEEIRDRGLVYEHLECWDAARRDLEHFLELCPEDRSAGVVRARLAELSGRESVLH